MKDSRALCARRKQGKTAPEAGAEEAPRESAEDDDGSEAVRAAWGH